MPPSKAGSLRKALAALQWQLMDANVPRRHLAQRLGCIWAVATIAALSLKMQEILSVSEL